LSDVTRFKTREPIELFDASNSLMVAFEQNLCCTT